MKDFSTRVRGHKVSNVPVGKASKILTVFLAVIFAVPCQSKGFCVDHLQDISAIKVELYRPGNYEFARGMCDRPGLDFLSNFAKLNEEEKGFCGDQLVPYDLVDRYSVYGIEGPKWPVVNFTSGKKRKVDDTFLFTCVLCQRTTVIYPLLNNNPLDDKTSSSFYKVFLTKTEKELKQTLNYTIAEETKRELAQKLGGIFKVSASRPIRYQDHFVDEEQHLHVEFHVQQPISRLIDVGELETSILNDTFSMRVEDVSFCTAGDTVDVDGVVSHWPRVDLVGNEDSFQFVVNASTGAITRRDCRFNYQNFHGEWLPTLSRWELAWTRCGPSKQYENEENYKQFLNASDIDRRHAEELHNFTNTQVDKEAIKKVANYINREVRTNNLLSEQTIFELPAIFANLTSLSDHYIVRKPRASLIIADINVTHPIEGFTLSYDRRMDGGLDTITPNRKPILKGTAPYALDISARILEAHKRLALTIIWIDVPSQRWLKQKTPTCQYIEVIIIFPNPYEVSMWSFASYANHDVIITYDTSVLRDYKYGIDYYNFLLCVAWNNDLRDWSSYGCKMLDTNQTDFRACRCSGKFFAMHNGVPIARYALRKGHAQDQLTFYNNPFTDFFKDKPGLIVATLIECLLSALGLGSIIATAILFKKWRENTGHKILLHMVLALTCNLVLGFVASFMRMTTENVGCLIYGVLRHYSFLAMFLWMLVLSCLQLKRLTTVAGAKGTSHLILKVSLFAWGLPLVPIIFLLSYNYGFYQSDRFDRGYCYPEGIVFEVTVQGPAGLILFVNTCIFVKIVMHIFDCGNDSKITRHSKNERAEQLNKLKTSLFIFFLFGFTWIFHIFSEERVLVSDFLFEFLFLMTATTHIFVLSLFFVVLQDGTRKEWIELISAKMSKK